MHSNTDEQVCDFKYDPEKATEIPVHYRRKMQVHHQSSGSLLLRSLRSESAQIERSRPCLILQRKRASLTLPLSRWNMRQQCTLAAKEADSVLGSASAWRRCWCDLI